tara:strand:- start:22 stop:306 length:285 start_codon:yes stop_codon:yes gene_type:complete
MDAQVEIALAVAVAEEVTQAVTSVETQDVTVMVQQAVAVDLTSLLDQRYHQELLRETMVPQGNLVTHSEMVQGTEMVVQVELLLVTRGKLNGIY